MGAVTDNQGNSYTRRARAAPSGQNTFVAIYQAIATTSSGTFTITVNPDGASADFTLVISEWPGNAAAPFDQASNSDPDAAASQTANTTNATPSEDNELIICAMTHCGTDRTITERETLIYENEGGSANMPIGASYVVQTSAGAVSGQWTIGTGNVVWGACIATFKAAAGASSQIKKLAGVNQANLKKVSGLAAANVKKVAGVSNT
jgi:hypothetical protein